MRARAAVVLSAGILASCVGDTPGARTAAMAQDTFWSALQDLCGSAHEGTVIEAPPGDTTFAGKQLVMHVRSCTDDTVRIPFHVGADRSRTWVVSRSGGALVLKHDHRHEDGAEDEITQYGGTAREGGTGSAQEFPADSFTATLIPAAARNVWTLEVDPGSRFAYALRREGTDRRFRLEFDLSSRVSPPPPPWGSEP
ncbi:MAG TPA: hypothetical protein VFZ69_17565 [Longimicrobiales bacterium]